MILNRFEGSGSTDTRRKFWDEARTAVMASQKIAGKNVSVDEHTGKGTVINVNRNPLEIGDICCDGNVCRLIPFHPDCQNICGVFILGAPCSACDDNWCPPHNSHVTAVVDGLTECGCMSVFGGNYATFVFDLDGTYDMGTMSESVPCVWEITIPNAVTETIYSASDCTGDPIVTYTFDVLLRFSCSSLLPETGVHIFGRIYEASDDVFDLFNDGEDFTHMNPWVLTNPLSCGDGNSAGTGGTITFSWA